MAAVYATGQGHRVKSSRSISGENQENCSASRTVGIYWPKASIKPSLVDIVFAGVSNSLRRLSLWSGHQKIHFLRLARADWVLSFVRIQSRNVSDT